MPNKKGLKWEDHSASNALQAGASGKDILEKRCASCHDNGASLGGVASLDWNEMIINGHMIDGDPEASRIYIRTANGTMPPSGAIPLEEVSLLWQYIKTGGAPTGGGVQPTPTPTPTLTSTYSSIRDNVLTPKCMGCHNDAQAVTLGGGVSLDDYNDVLGQVNTSLAAASRIYVRGYNKTMPPGGVNALTTEELLAIYNWINQGAPNN